MSLKRRLKEAYQQALRKMFELGPFLGFDVLPRHFCSEIPDIRALRKNNRMEIALLNAGSVRRRHRKSARFCKSCYTPAMQELLSTKDIPALASERNGEGFGPIEADFLHGICRHDLGNIRNCNKGIEWSRVDFKGFANAE